MKLRPYQAKLAAEAEACHRFLFRSTLMVLATAGGKTVIFSQVTRDSVNAGLSVWVIAHRKELISQASKTLKLFGIDHGIIKSGHPLDPTKRVQVASMQTVIRRLDKLPPPDLIIWDECFPKDTLVDGTPIEHLEVGDLVDSFDHEKGTVEKKKILGIFNRQYRGSWVKVTTTDGASFVCTEGHPVYISGRGYFPAAQLSTIDDHEKVYLLRNGTPSSEKTVLQRGVQTKKQRVDYPHLFLQMVWRGFHTTGFKNQRFHKKERLRLLFEGLQRCVSKSVLIKNYGRDKSEIRISKDEGKKSNEASRDTAKDDFVNEGQRVQRARREREDNPSSTEITRGFRVNHGVRNFCKRRYQAVWKSFNPLQSGSSFSRIKDSGGGRWQRTSKTENESSGCEEDQHPELVGLDCVEIYKRGSGQRPSWVPSEDSVFNLHVEGNNNYFAEGILVHNCHHAVCNTATKIIGHYPDASILGVTATPIRLNGAGLGSVFEHMILGPTTQWLTDQAYLSPAKYFGPPSKANLSNLHTRGGDYIVSELEEVMDQGVITGDAVAHYKRICDGVPMIVFCVSIAHAKHVAEEYRNAGYRAESVDGNLSDEDRDDRIQGLASGKYQIITSCELIGEGLDVPVVVAVQILRPTESLVYHLQFIGRALRPIYADGYDLDDLEQRITAMMEGPKKTAFILDHVGNTGKHGFATTPRNWTLEGRVKRSCDKPPATRTCDVCYAVHPPAKNCPFCGFEYPVKTRSLTSQKVVDGELVEIVQTPEERAEEVKKAHSMKDLIAIAKARGYKRPAYWAMKTLRGRSYVHLLPKG